MKRRTRTCAAWRSGGCAAQQAPFGHPKEPSTMSHRPLAPAHGPAAGGDAHPHRGMRRSSLPVWARAPPPPPTPSLWFSPSCYFCIRSSRNRTRAPLWRRWLRLTAGSLGSAGRWQGLQQGPAMPSRGARPRCRQRWGSQAARQRLARSQQVPTVRVKGQTLHAHRRRFNSPHTEGQALNKSCLFLCVCWGEHRPHCLHLQLRSPSPAG